MSEGPRKSPRREDFNLDALKSAELRTALSDALVGKDSRLEDLLARHGGLPGPRPNVALAEALAVAISAEPKADSMLAKWTAEDVSGDDPRAFLAIAAAYGYVFRLESSPNWDALCELAADERSPVRVGVIAALSTWTAKADGRIDLVVQRAFDWLELDDRELRFGAAGVVLDVLASRKSFEGLRDTAELKRYLESVQAMIADAPRAAERSSARRRALLSLPTPLAHVAGLRGSEEGLSWLVTCCEQAKHPDIRKALEVAIEQVRKTLGQASASPLVDALRSSAKPLRDPSRKRQGLRGRGKKR